MLCNSIANKLSSKCLYIKQKARLGDQPVILFLVRFGRRDRWDALLQRTLWLRNLDLLSRFLCELAQDHGLCVTDAVSYASTAIDRLSELMLTQLQGKQYLMRC